MPKHTKPQKVALIIALICGAVSSAWLLYHWPPGSEIVLGIIPGLVLLFDLLLDVKYRNKIIIIVLIIPCAAGLTYSSASNVTATVFALLCWVCSLSLFVKVVEDRKRDQEVSKRKG